MNTRHPRRSSLGSVVLFTAASLLVGGIAWSLSPNPRDLPPPPADAQGLERTASSKVDQFYLRPGATFTAYRRVMLGTVDVSFNKLWERQHREVDAKESAKLRAELQEMARKEFAAQLQRKGGFEVVQAGGPDVLEVRASIVNLDIHAPDVQDSTVRRNYVLSAGEATLVAELRDSQTGTLLARIVDRREMREYPTFQLATSVSNSGDARDLVGLWSRMLRRYLDTARADGKGS